jgi:hypothetical protein
MGKLRQLEVSSGNVKRADAVRRELRHAVRGHLRQRKKS